MGATSKLLTILGIDTSEYNKGIDGAEQRADSFAGSFKKVKSSITMAFAASALFKFQEAVEKLRKYQETTGFKIIGDDDLTRLESAAATIEKIKMTLAGAVVGGVAKMIGGIQAAAAEQGVREVWRKKMLKEGTDVKGQPAWGQMEGPTMRKPREMTAQEQISMDNEITQARGGAINEGGSASRAKEIAEAKKQADEAEKRLLEKTESIKQAQEKMVELQKQFTAYEKDANLSATDRLAKEKIRKEIAEQQMLINEKQQTIDNERKHHDNERKQHEEKISRLKKDIGDEDVAREEKSTTNAQKLEANLTRQRELVGDIATLNDMDGANGEAELEARKELGKELTNEKAIRKAIADTEKKRADIIKEGKEAIDKIKHPRAKIEVESDPTSAMQRGMWMGERDLSRVKVQSHAEKIQQEVSDEVKLIRKRLDDLGG